MKRRTFFKDICVGIGLSPLLLAGTLKAIPKRQEYVYYGDYIEVPAGELKKRKVELKDRLKKQIREAMKHEKINKKDIVGIQLIERFYKPEAISRYPMDCIGWKIKVRKK